MKKILLSFVALFALSATAQIQTVTVADGNYDNAYVPIWGYYCDEYQHNQYVIPASMLGNLEGVTFTQLTWYLSHTATISQNITLTIKLAEVNDTVLTSLITPQTLTTVWSGPYTGMDEEPTMVFSNTYYYQGGNLLVDITTDEGMWTNSKYYGIQRTNGAWYSHSQSGVPTAGGAVQNFLPKTTIGYSASGNVCLPPTGLTIDSTTSTSVSISWQADTSVHAWLVSDDNQTWVRDTVRHHTFINLTPNHNYTFYVRNLCSSGDTSFATSLPCRTLCGAIMEFPYNEDFDNGGENCWTIVSQNSSSSDNWQHVATVGIDNTAGFFSRYGSTSDPSNDWLISPPIALPQDAAGFEFIWYGKNRLYHETQREPYAVRVSTTTNNPAAFTDSIITIYSAEDWRRYSFSLSQYAGQTIYVAFHHFTTEDAWGIYIDNVSVKATLEPMVRINTIPYAAINTPTTIHASLLEGSAQNLSVTWTSTLCQECVTANNLTATLNYTSPGIDTLICTATNHYGTGRDTIILNVIDRTPVTVYPYSTGFEVGEDTNWYSFSGTNAWYIGTAAHYSGQRALYISDDNGVSNHYQDYADSRSYAVRTFQFTDTGDYVVSFDWRCMGDYDGMHFLQAAIAPGSVVFAGNAQLGINSYGDVDEGWIELGFGPMYGDSIWRTVQNVFTIHEAGLYQVVFYWRNDAYEGFQPPAAVDNFMLNHLTCPAPHNVVLNDLTPTSVSFHWTPGGDESAWNVRVADVDTIVTTPYCAVAGLTPSTNYMIDVRAVCSAGDTSFSLRREITTECEAVSLPVTYDFEMDSTAAFVERMDCWRFIGPNIYTYNYDTYITPGSVRLTAYAHSGERSLLFYATAARKAMITTPQIDYPGNRLSVRFWSAGFVSGNTGSVPGVFQAGVMTNPFDSTTFIPLLTITNDSVMQQYEFNTTSVTGNAPVTVAFRCTTQGAASYICIDDLTIEAYNPCGFVQNVTVRGITGEEATVEWQAPSTEANSYRVLYGVAGQYTDSITVAGSPCTITGLTPSTYYNVKVRTVCTEGISNFSDETTFMTTCPAVTQFPFTESFEHGFGCWTVIDGNSDGIVWSNLTADNDYPAHLGNHMAASYSWYNSMPITPDEWLISPRMALPANADTITLSWYYIVNENYSADHYTVYVSTGSSDRENFVALDSVTGTMTNSMWTARQLDLSAYAGQSIYFAFRHHNCTNQNYIMLDDILLNVSVATEPCEAPTVVSTSTTTSTATIEFAGEAETYEVYITSGAWVTPQAGVPITEHTYTFTGLTPEQQYTLGVRAICADGRSEWVTASVTTLASGGNAINGVDEASIALYPNPASSSVTLSGIAGAATVSVVDMNGRTVDQWNVRDGKLTIDVASMAKGAYFVRIVGEQVSAIRKLVVK